MTTKKAANLFTWALIAVVSAFCAAWLWRSFCLFPAHGWNEVRLAPVFQWVESGSPYPDPTIGPTTTWIYGPVPLALMLPAALAKTAAAALLTGAGINIFISVAAIVFVCAFWPAAVSAPPTQRASRTVAAIGCIALWPGTTWRFFQPDNAAVAFGLISMFALQQGERKGGAWLAPAACVAALFCKQLMAGLLIAECLWLFLARDITVLKKYLLRVTALGLVGGLASAAFWGASPVWYYWYTLPKALPWAASIPGRLQEFWPVIVLHVALPLALMMCFWRAIWQSGSLWLLPFVCWAAMWPLDLASLLKTGGSVNSLHGLQLFLPPVAVLLLTRYSSCRAVAVTALSIALAVTSAQLISVAPGTWLPRVEHLRTATSISSQYSGQVYFPWHPLASYFSERRIDEVEDGLFIRYLIGEPVSLGQAHLPPHFHAIAYRREELDWGIVRSLIPPTADIRDIGAWRLYSWPVKQGTANP